VPSAHHHRLVSVDAAFPAEIKNAEIDATTSELSRRSLITIAQRLDGSGH